MGGFAIARCLCIVSLCFAVAKFMRTGNISSSIWVMVWTGLKTTKHTGHYTQQTVNRKLQTGNHETGNYETGNYKQETLCGHHIVQHHHKNIA